MTFRPPFVILILVLLIAACAGDSAGPKIVDRGIGGTGVAVTDRGIGGTGIVGTVTAFGSVWVNGLRVELPPTVSASIEGQPVDASAIGIGHLVAMTAAPGGPTGLTARTIEIRYAVAGPVASVDGTAARILGQRIEAARAVGRDILHPGSWVAVSGLRRLDGTIVAGRIDRWDEGRGWLLRGRLDAIGPAVVTVAGWRVPRAGLDGALPPLGSPVRVGGWSDGAVGTPTLVPDPLNPFGSAVGALSVETYVEAGGHSGGSRMVIDGAVEPGGRLRGSRSFGAPDIGATMAPGADAAARAAGLAGEAARREASPVKGPADGMAPPGAEAPRPDDARGWGRPSDADDRRESEGLGSAPGVPRGSLRDGVPGAPPGGSRPGPPGGAFGGFGNPGGGAVGSPAGRAGIGPRGDAR